VVGADLSLAILLSTYNGGLYLKDLLDSLYSQVYQDFDIFVRDDGSLDNTRDILGQISCTHGRVYISCGENLGVVESFFNLLCSAPDSYDYYAFCDQDDIWQNNKLSSAIDQIEANDPGIPLLYFSRVEFVDAKLSHLGYSDIPQEVSFEHTLVENLAPGCTMVINRSARKLIFSNLPEFALMHDWWVLLVISAFGKVMYDSEPKILYRQHSSNVVGGTTDRFKTNLKKIRPFIKSVLDPTKKRTSDQVLEFRRLFGEKLNFNQKRLVDEFIQAKPSLFCRIKLVTSGKFRRQNAVDNFVFSLLTILGYY
jgi:glycosyltransferase involved in cell wall biosynthesis